MGSFASSRHTNRLQTLPKKKKRNRKTKFGKELRSLHAHVHDWGKGSRLDLQNNMSDDLLMQRGRRKSKPKHSPASIDSGKREVREGGDVPLMSTKKNLSLTQQRKKEDEKKRRFLSFCGWYIKKGRRKEIAAQILSPVKETNIRAREREERRKGKNGRLRIANRGLEITKKERGREKAGARRICVGWGALVCVRLQEKKKERGPWMKVFPRGSERGGRGAST